MDIQISKENTNRYEMTQMKSSITALIRGFIAYRYRQTNSGGVAVGKLRKLENPFKDVKQ